MVTPENGTLRLVPLAGGQPATYSLYSSDVNTAPGTPVTFSLIGLAAAGSVTFITIPFDCVIDDVSLTTGQTVSKIWTVWLNDAPVPAAIMSYAQIVDTSPNRVFPQLRIAKGTKFQLMQT